MRNELLSMLDRLESSLPANTLDQLIDDLGGTENVAEVSPLISEYLFHLSIQGVHGELKSFKIGMIVCNVWRFSENK